jgi:DNA-binding XRE family transcriptional regulator
MTTASQKLLDIQRQERRTKVASLMVAGTTQRKMAQVLDVSDATVHRDVQAVLDEWRESRLLQIDAAKLVDVQRTEEMLRAIYLAARRGDMASIGMCINLIRLKADLLQYTEVPAQHTQVNAPITVIEVVRPVLAVPAEESGE